MGQVLNIQLQISAEQREGIDRLQAVFARACNELARLVRETRCWNRVALHHLAYHRLREQFPELGSQMVCNAIYSVSRAARLIYQGRHSPWNVVNYPSATLPLMTFSSCAPVFFDRHTLSLKDGCLSMYTLDGRVRFHVALDKADERRFHEQRLKEVLLRAGPDGCILQFVFADEFGAEPTAALGQMPDYVVVVEPISLRNQGQPILGITSP